MLELSGEAGVFIYLFYDYFLFDHSLLKATFAKVFWGHAVVFQLRKKAMISPSKD